MQLNNSRKFPKSRESISHSRKPPGHKAHKNKREILDDILLKQHREYGKIIESY
jgi:hypothetical protein